MNEQKVTLADFNNGIDKFIEILNTQPDWLLRQTRVAEDGKMLADMAVQFSLRLAELKTKHCND